MATIIDLPPSRGKLIGTILLIAGSCIGAGMLGLPVLTATAGFQPSTALFLIAWLFMMTTGLLLLEVNLWYTDEISLISMTERTLGTIGKWVCWGTFLFLFYSVLVAYVTASGSLFADGLLAVFGISSPAWVGSLLFTLLFGALIFYGVSAVDQVNRVLMCGLIASYLLLLYLGAPHVNRDHLQEVNWKASLLVIPPMVISFGYHNLIPSLTTYLQRHRRHLILSIVIGSLIPLAVYLVWEWLMLGIVPMEGPGGYRQILGEGHTATHALAQTVGSSWIATAAESFAFFAIVTSFLSLSLSFVDFLSDGLGIAKDTAGKALLSTMTLAPPFALALLYPTIFLVALNYAGAFGAVILFGLLPALMVWKGRYYLHKLEQKIVPGGRFTLILVIIFSLTVTLLQLAHELGWLI